MGRKTKLKPVFRVKIKGDPTDRTVLLRRGDFAVDHTTTGQLSASYAPVVSDEMDLADHENDPHLAARRFVELLAGIKEPETAHKTFPGFNVTVVGQDSQVTQTVIDMGPLDATQLKKLTDTLAKGDNGAKHEVVEQDVATGDVALPTALQQQLAKREQAFIGRQLQRLDRLDATAGRVSYARYVRDFNGQSQKPAQAVFDELQPLPAVATLVRTNSPETQRLFQWYMAWENSQRYLQGQATLTPGQQCALRYVNEQIAKFEAAPGHQQPLLSPDEMSQEQAQVLLDMYQEAKRLDETGPRDPVLAAQRGELYSLEPLRQLKDVRARLQNLQALPVKSQLQAQQLQQLQQQEQQLIQDHIRASYDILELAHLVQQQQAGSPFRPLTGPENALVQAADASLATYDGVRQRLLRAVQANQPIPADVAPLVAQLQQEQAAPGNPFAATEAARRLNPNHAALDTGVQGVVVKSDQADDHLHARGVRGSPAYAQANLQQCAQLDAQGLPDASKPMSDVSSSEAKDYWETHEDLWKKDFTRYKARAAARGQRQSYYGNEVHGALSTADLDEDFHRDLNAAFSLDEASATPEQLQRRVRNTRRRARSRLDRHRTRLLNNTVIAASLAAPAVYHRLAAGPAVLRPGNAWAAQQGQWPVDGNGRPFTAKGVAMQATPLLTQRQIFQSLVARLTNDAAFAERLAAGMSDAGIDQFMDMPVADFCHQVTRTHLQFQATPIEQMGVGQPFANSGSWLKWLRYLDQEDDRQINLNTVSAADLEIELQASPGDRAIPPHEFPAFKRACERLLPPGSTPSMRENNLRLLRQQVRADYAWDVLKGLQRGNPQAQPAVAPIVFAATTPADIMNLGAVLPTAIPVAERDKFFATPPGNFSQNPQLLCELQRRFTIEALDAWDKQHVQPVRDELSTLHDLMHGAPEGLLREMRAAGIITPPDVSTNPSLRQRQLNNLAANIGGLQAWLTNGSLAGSAFYQGLTPPQQAQLNQWQAEVVKETQRLATQPSITGAQTLAGDATLQDHEANLLALGVTQLERETQLRQRALGLNTAFAAVNAAIVAQTAALDHAAGGDSQAMHTLATRASTAADADYTVMQHIQPALTSADALAALPGGQLDIAQASVGQLVRLRQELVTARGEYNQAVRDFQQHFQQARTALSALESRHQGAQTALARAKSTRDKVDAKYRSNAQRLRHVEGEIARLEASLRGGNLDAVDRTSTTAQLSALKTERGSLENLQRAAQGQLTAAQASVTRAQRDFNALDGELQACQTAMQDAENAFRNKMRTEDQHLTTLEHQVDSLLAHKKDLASVDRYTQLLHDARLTDNSHAQYKAQAALRSSMASRDGHMSVANMQLADSYAQAVVSGQGQDWAKVYHQQTQADDVNKDVDQLQSKVDSFLDRQQELLKDEDAAKKMAKQARAKRKKAIMEALDLKAIGREDDLLRAVTKAHSGYFTSPKQALKQCKNMLLGAGSRQHVSVDLQSALPLIFLRALMAIFLLLFAGFMAVKNKIHDAAGREKTQNQALERLVAYHIKANDGKLDLDALKRDLLSGAEDNALWANGDGKTKKDLEEQMHIIQLKAARYAYAMGVEPEDIKGWQNIKHKDGIGRKFSDAHKFEAFLDDQDASHTQSSYTHAVADYQQWTDEYQSTMQGKQTQQLKASNQRAPVLTSPSTCRTPNYLSHGAKKGPSTGGGMPSLPPGIATH